MLHTRYPNKIDRPRTPRTHTHRIMSTATNPQPAEPPTPPQKQAAAATVLGRVFGEEVLSALHEGVLKGDLTGVVPLLAAATAKPYLRAAAQAAFAAVCDAGEADAAALLLECGGIDGHAAVNPGYVRPTDEDEEFLHNDEESEEGDTALTRAARFGRSEIVRMLVASGKVDANRPGPNGGLPLVLAIRSKNTACVEALLSTVGIDANAAVNPTFVHGLEDVEEGDTILVRAAREGNAGAVRALVESGKADVNRAAPNGELPLVQAIYSNHGACAEILLATDDVDTNQVDGDGWTALFAAANKGSIMWVQHLLGAAGVAVNHTDESGDTALCRAAFHGHAGCIGTLLLTNGIDVNKSQPLLATIMHQRGGWEACARALASAKGIDLNHRHNHTGRTALHAICKMKHAALAEHLLIAGGCRFALATAGIINGAQTKAGDTALSLAAGDKAVTKLFASGVDYWQRRRHGGHGWAMKEAVLTLLLVRQRLGAQTLVAPGPAHAAGGALPHLPEEIWLAALEFLRSADFVPPNV